MSSTHNRSYCPVCGNTLFFNTISSKPHVAVQCDVCKLGIESHLAIRPDAYLRKQYDQVRDAGAGADRWARFHHDSAVAALRFSQLSDAISGYSRGAVWVDVGCGNGALLCEARRLGWIPCGIESDPGTCEEIKSMTGVPVFPYSSWVDFSIGRASVGLVDVVSFFDSLEHMLDPVGAVLVAASRLSSRGAIVIEAPDLGGGPVDELWFRDWKHRRVIEEFTEHIWHFSHRSLEELRKRHLPEFESVLTASPLEGRLQVVWRAPASSKGSPELDFEDEVSQLIRDQRVEVEARKEPEEPQSLAFTLDTLNIK